MKKSAMRLVTLWAALLVAGCAWLDQRGRTTQAGNALPPLLLRQVQVIGDDSSGSRTVLLRFSRPPEVIRHEGKDRPARVVIEAGAPDAGEDFAERTMPQADREVKGVRVARKGGVLRVTVELARDGVPPYTLREMADWVLIRLEPSGPRG